MADAETRSLKTIRKRYERQREILLSVLDVA